MAENMKLLTALSVFLSIGLIGCSTLVVPSVEATISRTDGEFVDRSSNRNVDIAELLPFMRRATWRSGLYIWKDYEDLVLSDGRTIRIDALNPAFTIGGVKGTFYIREEDESAYEKARRRLGFF